MRERGSQRATSEAPEGSSAELDRLLATIHRRRSQQATRARAAGGDAAPLRTLDGGVRGAGVQLPDAAARSASPRAAAARPVPGKPVSTPIDADSDAAGGLVFDVRNVGSNVLLLRVSRPRGFSFRAGQAIKLGLPGTPVRRTYSIASAPRDAHLEFCIERVPGGVFSSLLENVVPGARFELAAKPKGSLSLQSDKRQHLMVATVTGIAPLRSVLRDALAAGSAGDYWILHGASYADELPYADELTELGRRDARVRYLPTVSRPESPRNQGWAGKTGRVEAHVIELAQSLGPTSGVAVYACGHPDMVRNVQVALGALGYTVSGEDFG